MDGPLDRYDAPQWLGAKAKRRFHAMVKPAGSACNLGCGYCFYLSKPALPGGPGAGHMDDELLELFVRQYIAGVTGDEVVFSWQGGEPTLRGVDFFRKVVALQQKYAKPGQRIENDLQTNGTLLDEDWARFLKEHRFLVGLSIDGPRELHDRYRVTKRGAPTFDAVFAAAALLRRFGVRFNTLTCVNRCNASRPLDVYRFLRRELGSTYLQFIPVVQARGFEHIAPGALDPSSLPFVGEPRSQPDHPDSIVTEWSVDSDEYGRFLCSIWDEWRRRDFGKVLVNFAETLADMVFSPTQVRFGYAKSETLPRHCRECEFLSDCWGECPKNRLLRAPDGEPGVNYLCRGLKRFYRHAVPQAERIAAQLRATRVATGFDT